MQFPVSPRPRRAVRQGEQETATLILSPRKGLFSECIWATSFRPDRCFVQTVTYEGSLDLQSQVQKTAEYNQSIQEELK